MNLNVQVVNALERLVNGELSIAEFNAEISPERLLGDLETTKLPGTLRTTG